MVENRILKSTCLGAAGVDGLAEVPPEHPICDGCGGTRTSPTDNTAGMFPRDVQTLLLVPCVATSDESVCTRHWSPMCCGSGTADLRRL